MHLASMRVECLSNVLYDTPTSSVRPSAWRPLLMAEISAKTLMAKNIANFGLKMGCCGQKYAYWPIKLLSWFFGFVVLAKKYVSLAHYRQVS